MSKQITIQEGGQPKSLTVDKLQTALVGGGSCLWVPEEDTRLKTKHITQNGTYKAASDDAYGYSEVTINVAGGNGSADSHGVPTISDGTLPGGIGSSVIGKDPETGNDVGVGVDEDGNLVQTPVPSYIKVTKPPDKTEYHAGETINPTGIIVHAYLNDGTDFGTVLNSELVYPEPVAPEGGESDEWTDGDGLNAKLFNVNVQGKLGGWTPPPTIYVSDSPAGNRQNNNVYYSDDVPRTILMTQYDGKVYILYKGSSTDEQHFASRAVYYNGETGLYRLAKSASSNNGYYNQWILDYAFNVLVMDQSYIPVSTKMPTGGAEDLHPTGSTADIPVKWKSPYDGREMEDKFEITVTGSTPDDDGGDDGGGGAGHGF